MRNSAYVYPNHGQPWLTQRVLRRQRVVWMPQSARLLTESVYGEDITIPDGLIKAEQTQLAGYYCDRTFAHRMFLNFKPGYSPDSSDFLVDKLSTHLIEELVTLQLAKNINGQLLPYTRDAYPWEISMLRMRESWWRKHRTEFTLLVEKSLQQWCVQQHQNPDSAVVIIVADLPDCGCSASEGLIETMEVQQLTA